MHNSITWQQWAQQLSAYVEMQKQRIDQLEQTITKLQSDLNALKDQKRFHIDKIEYNFDQLKVEKLDGTLTIGISPSSLDNIEDFAVNGTQMGPDAGSDVNAFFQGQNQDQAQGLDQDQGQDQRGQGRGQGQRQQRQKQAQGIKGSEGKGQDHAQGIKQEVSSGIEQYLKDGVHDDIQNLENKYQYPMDEDYRDFIIDDIRKQLDTRIQHYVNQYRGAQFKEPMEAITNSIMDKTKQDIFSAIESYISNLPKKEG